MSGSNNYTINCPACKTSFPVRGKALSLYVTCPSCKGYFSQAPWNSERIDFRTSFTPAIKPGLKGRIDGTVYEVMGVVVKQERRYSYKWREYLLFNPYQGYAFLSEYNGNWNFIWPLENDPSGGSGSNNFYFENEYYRLYQRYTAEVVFAEGEFFFDVVNLTDTTSNAEYIAPPYMLAMEQSDDSLLWCQGEYISPNEIAAAFKIPVSSLPAKEGRGYTQPFSSNFSEKSLISISFILAGVLFLLQVLFANSADEQVLFDQTFDRVTLGDSAVFRTTSFDLPAISQGVEVELYAPVDNNWFYAEFALINETTGTEYNFSHEVEYYHGYDDGTWTEGSPYGTAFLSAVPGGKYHINIYPDFSSGMNHFAIKIKRDVVFWGNFIVTLLLIAVFPVFYFVRRRMIEAKRWEDSDYSPYHSS